MNMFLVRTELLLLIAILAFIHIKTLNKDTNIRQSIWEHSKHLLACMGTLMFMQIILSFIITDLTLRGLVSGAFGLLAIVQLVPAFYNLFQK